MQKKKQMDKVKTKQEACHGINFWEIVVLICSQGAEVSLK